jgi:hypothetical protein
MTVAKATVAIAAVAIATISAVAIAAISVSIAEGRVTVSPKTTPWVVATAVPKA